MKQNKICNQEKCNTENINSELAILRATLQILPNIMDTCNRLSETHQSEGQQNPIQAYTTYPSVWMAYKGQSSFRKPDTMSFLS